MKTDSILLYGGLAVVGFMLFSSFKSENGNVNDFHNLTNDEGDINRLTQLDIALLNRGLSELQIKMALAQILVESGLLTSVANYHNMDDLNNYAGLTKTSGGYAKYDSIDDFVDAYIGFLTKGSNPMGASTIEDFNNRLVANHYYTDSPVTYGNNLKHYFNMLG